MKLKIVFGFVAGFFATLLFHQMTLAGLWNTGFAPFPPFQMKPTWPFGIPSMISLAFWGGIWGIAFVLLYRHFPRWLGYWLGALLFGAIAPTLVALLIVVPLKGGALGGGWQWKLWLTALLVNGSWGIGTALIYSMLPVRRS